jgi:hypothetical protein
VLGRVGFGSIASAVLIVVAGCGGGGSGTNSVNSTQASATTHHRHHVVPCRNGEYGDVGYRYPGRILGIPDGYFYSGDMTRDRKMWWVNDCRHFTVVGGGADPDHLQTGLLGILREPDRAPHHESTKYIKVPGAGAVVITKAPLGPSVETWAQKRGNIEFKGKHGITGTLHLRDDTVTLNQ